MLGMIVPIWADSSLILYPCKIIGTKETDWYCSPSGCLIAAGNPRIVWVKNLGRPPVLDVSAPARLLHSILLDSLSSAQKFWNAPQEDVEAACITVE